VGDLSDQVHDFEPGIKRSGLFWTIPVASQAIDADLLQHRARYHLRDLAVPDFHDFLNAVSPNPARQPGRASFEVHWAANGPRARIRDATFGFVGAFMPAAVTIGFHVTDLRTGAVYHSLPDGQITVGAGIGHERNGVFFS
jgi:hypothetical protein